MINEICRILYEPDMGRNEQKFAEFLSMLCFSKFIIQLILVILPKKIMSANTQHLGDDDIDIR